MLLACAGHATPAALDATRQLLAAGAVPDTWAPNGSSALMLAASVDCAEGVALLLDNAASLELQDALGRCGPAVPASSAAAPYGQYGVCKSGATAGRPACWLTALALHRRCAAGRR